jgi:hypothetical protein
VVGWGNLGKWTKKRSKNRHMPLFGAQEGQIEATFAKDFCV